ncbi:iron ABC transporter [Flavobacterium cyanobacteriorum]|uniref:Iron ABC transporter n=1 Tax=Flavobacterium cyanobacteriorum TaxID=2022802 RepID=A0A255YY26_9FLAO|nr:iron ABC transporter permease [Flavobacterium cyanobacteriorum]OYQ34079.1 iron ABC transporter [Flavobacterium cyanobacteriorum]
MQRSNKNSILFILLSLVLVSFFIMNISLGAVKIPLEDVVKSITGGTAAKETWQYIIINYRLPKAITAVVVGMGLSVSGLLMQTLFRNPLAGPYVLGLSSGASLGVAFVLLGAGMLPAALSIFFLSPYGIVLASTLGSLLVLLAVLLVARRLRDTMAILIVGLMFGSFTGAIVGILTFFSTAEQLQKFTFWSLGSLGNLPWGHVGIMATVCAAGLMLAACCIKPLNALLLGERYAISMGINFRRTRFIIIAATSLMAGGITAFAGPIAFVGLAVPHMAKLLFRTSSHFVLYRATLLIGGIIVLLCDTLTQLPGNNFILPVNAITSIIGAPVVVWLLLRRRKGIYS